MSLRRITGAAAALSIGLLAVLASASPAQAQEADCKSVVTTLVDRPDSAVGGGTWALDRLERTVNVCQTEPGEYHAAVVDAGTFLTVELDHTPAGGDQPLPAGIEGTIAGGFTADFEAAADWASFDPAHLDGATIPWVGDGSDLPSGQWVSSLFGDDFAGSALNDDWSWTYRTLCGDEAQEEWVNQTATLGGNKGDITEVPDCPEPPASPSPTPTVEPTPTAGTDDQPGGTAGGGKQLPTTGGDLPLYAAGAAALIGAGFGLYFAFRSRSRPTFTVE